MSLGCRCSTFCGNTVARSQAATGLGLGVCMGHIVTVTRTLTLWNEGMWRDRSWVLEVVVPMTTPKSPATRLPVGYLPKLLDQLGHLILRAVDPASPESTSTMPPTTILNG